MQKLAISTWGNVVKSQGVREDSSTPPTAYQWLADFLSSIYFLHVIKQIVSI
jgi:hypothetical protein